MLLLLGSKEIFVVTVCGFHHYQSFVLLCQPLHGVTFNKERTPHQKVFIVRPDIINQKSKYVSYNVGFGKVLHNHYETGLDL